MKNLTLLIVFLCVDVQALVILQYHHVSNDTPSSTSVTPERFSQHLSAIDLAGFQVVSLEDIAQAIRDGSTLPDHSAVITFDDGYRSIYDEAYPMLKKRGWPFTVFINTDPHDQKLPSHMSWDELREISSNGAMIANHSRSHRHILRRDVSDKDASAYFRDEIDYAEKRIKRELGDSVKWFAYPFGEYDLALESLLKKHGYLAFGQQSGAVPNNLNLQSIPRFPFGGHYGDPTDFKTKLHALAFDDAEFYIEDEEGNKIEEMYLGKHIRKPIVFMRLPENIFAKDISCYASGQGKINVSKRTSLSNLLKSGSNEIRIQANKKLSAGRSRYNCTARSKGGRYHWWSTTFVKKGRDGHWQHQ